MPQSGNYVSSTDLDDEHTLRLMLRDPKPIRFDWENKWLRGDQYAHMLFNMSAYAATFNMEVLKEKTHPQNIYLKPESKSPILPKKLFFI